ncbi:MAG TPA: hypothetical protein H9871_01570, partial [Candidatus Nesterenkonia stercoripullorum]|nr:hypothetical protein [Candidatus Nesterenkonia stercoripullorum]
PSYATPLDGPEPSGIAALAAAVQVAEALQLSGELVVNGQQPPEPHELLHHLDLLAPEAPGAVGASLRVARQVAASSPAFRVAGATSGALAEVRRAAAVYAVPVEPVEASAVREEAPEPGHELQLSVCLSGPQQRLCKPPVASLEEALTGI